MRYVIEQDVMIPLSDGTLLAADIYRPEVAEGKKLPTLLSRTPYVKDNNINNVHEIHDMLEFMKNGYAIVLQDSRSTGKSEGTVFHAHVNEGQDGFDTIKWIAKQDWSNGKTGTYGASYSGMNQWASAHRKPDELLAMALVTGASNYYQAPWYHNGVLSFGLALSWNITMAMMNIQREIENGEATNEKMKPLLEMQEDIFNTYERLPISNMPELKDNAPTYFEWLNHSSYDEYWQQFSYLEQQNNINLPVLNISGWYDFFIESNIDSYVSLKKYGNQRLVIGAWDHSGSYSGIYSEKNFGPNASAAIAELNQEQIKWFNKWLKGEDIDVVDEKPVKIFVMGSNEWREETDWPLPDTRYVEYYLHSNGGANSLRGDGSLGLEKPSELEMEDMYLYDPANPVPTRGGAAYGDIFAGLEAGPMDQRILENREDVLCYTTEPLEKDTEITGHITLKLYISSSAKDTDFIGRLVDVHPDGRAEIITDGILRTRYRETLSEAKLMEPGEVYELEVKILPTSNVFKKGHAIRLDITSSSFPRYERNTNTGGNIAEESEFTVAVNRVYHDVNRPSHLLLPIIERE